MCQEFTKKKGTVGILQLSDIVMNIHFFLVKSSGARKCTPDSLKTLQATFTVPPRCEPLINTGQSVWKMAQKYAEMMAKNPLRTGCGHMSLFTYAVLVITDRSVWI